MATRPSVALRLGMQADGSIKQVLDGIAADGDKSAQRLVDTYTRANDDMVKAAERRAEAEAKIFSIVPKSNIQAAQEAAVGTGYGDPAGTAQASASVFVKALAEQERQVEALRVAIDPLYAAQKRFDAEIEVSSGLLSRGAISEREYAAAVALSTAALDKVRAAQAAPTIGTRMGGEADAQVKTYLAYQAEQARQANALLDAIEPLRVAQRAYDDEMAVANAQLARGTITEEQHAAAVQLAGRTFDDARKRLNGLSEAHSGASTSGAILQHVIRSTTDSMAAGLPISMIAGEQLSRLAEAARYAAQESGETEGRMATFASFLSGGWGLALTAAISILAVFGPKLLGIGEAGEKAADAYSHEALAADTLTQATAALDKATGASLKNKQEEIALSVAATQQKLKEALAQRQVLAARLDILKTPDQVVAGGGDLPGGTGITEAATSARMAVSAIEANEKAIKEAQEALRGAGFSAIVDRVTASTDKAKAADMAYEAEKHRLQQAVVAGTMSEKDAEAALLKAETTKQTAIQSTRLHTSATAADAEAQGRLQAASNAVQRAEAQLVITKRDVSAELKAGTIDQAQATAKIADAERAVHNAEAAEKSATATRHAFNKETRDAAQAHKEMLDSVLKLAAAGDGGEAATATFRKQVTEIDQLWKSGELSPEQAAAAGAAAGQAYTQALAASAKALDKERTPAINIQGDLTEGLDLKGSIAKEIADAGLKLKTITPAMKELQDEGTTFVDDVLSPQNWTTFGDMGKKVLNDLEAELLKLAAINPIKNWLLGGNSPTLSGVLGSASKLFGGSAASSINSAAAESGAISAVSAFSRGFSIPGFASGTDYAPGGVAWVAENGPELIHLPRGASVTPAAQTRRMLAANDGGSDTHNHYYVQGNLLTPEFWSQIQAGDDGAAVRGAYGGARLAGSDRVRQKNRTMR